MQIVNLTEFEPEWNWLASHFSARPELHWRHVTTRDHAWPAWMPRRTTLGRVSAALATRRSLGGDDAILVSHGPRMTMYGALANRVRAKRFLHLAYSFNFTQLPRGAERKGVQAAVRHVDRFAVFSTMERALYARYFDLDPERIDMIHWAARPPRLDPAAPRAVPGDYLCAVGSQARDYATLVEAMRGLPAVRLVIVANAASMQGLHVPPNVEVRLNVPLAQAHDIIAHCRFMVLPLTGSEVPCGHVTLVSAMHLGKAIVATRSEGITDYLLPGVNGVTAEPADPADLARQIGRLWESRGEAERMGQRGLAHALAHCGEAQAVEYFRGVLAAPRRLVGCERR